MSSSNSLTWLHRFAISTVCVALVTLTLGALTTSKNAGMAFRDWPTSDGINMLTYPWLNDFARNWDKFLEHGHRLAGALIGMWSIALVALTFKLDQRKWTRVLSVSILVGVICQGLLGGFRVQLDERGLAMLHGLFAAIVFSLMGAMVTLTSTRWAGPEQETDRGTNTLMKTTAVLIVAVLLGQFLLGGMIRHQGSGLHEHLGLGIAAAALIFMNAIFSGSSNVAWIRHSAWLLLLFTLGQVVLGGMAWVLKFGYTPVGYVAVADSIHQVSSRTAHTVWGIILFMSAVVHCLKVWRVSAVSEFLPEPKIVIHRTDSQLATGGNP